MQVKVGTDLVNRKRFEKSLKAGKEAFLKHLFLPQELKQNTKAQLASIFCVKEAVIKALELPQDSWLTISTNRKDNGKVVLSFLHPRLTKSIVSLDSSISHDGEWVMAVVVVCIDQSIIS